MEEIKKEHYKIEDSKTPQKDGSEEFSLNFSEIKDKTKRFFQSLKTRDKSRPERGEDEFSLSSELRQTLSFFKNNAKWLVPLACILIAMVFSVYLRTMPLRLPITDDWAQNSAYSFYKNQLSQQIGQQYPNLPEQNKNALVEKELAKFLEQNKEQVEQQISSASQQFKEQFKDDAGTLYLLGIDPWDFYHETSLILQNGFPGTEKTDEGTYWNRQRNAPVGVRGAWEFHSWFGAFLYKYIFLSKVPLLYSFFFIGVIFSALSVIPAFFIGRRLSGNNVGGFFTALLIAVTQFFVSRTTGESSDTDVYVVFFPLLITWLFLEAFETKNIKWRYTSIILAGLFTGIFSFAWKNGWWYIFGFILATLFLYLIYLLIIKNYKNWNINHIKETFSSNIFRNTFLLLLIYFALSSLIVSLFYGFNYLYLSLYGPLRFIQLKAVAVTSLWPNIHTTVAELNVASFTQVIDQLGGRLLFSLAILGILLTALKKDEEGHFDIKAMIFLAIWFIASMYATTKGVRFILQATPVFCLAFGAFAGFTYYYLSKWASSGLKIDKKISSVVVFILLALLLIQPAQAGYQQAFQSVPSMNDGWYNTLTKIKENSPPDNTIITSWWDFGHWFRAIADRSVTFDGGTQSGWGAYWVGRSLLTPDEKEAVGILRMMDCSQNSAFDELDKIFNDTPKEIDVLHELILEDKENAIRTLKEKYQLTNEQVASVIKYTHCTPPEAYYITSDDMVGKAGVWGHFGSWDFKKAAMHQAVTQSEEQSKQILEEKFDLSEEQADDYYHQITTTPADQWISTWPGYQGKTNCQQKGTLLLCPLSLGQGTATLEIDLNTLNASIPAREGLFHPNSLTYATKDSLEEKKFTENLIGLSVLLLPESNQIVVVHPLQAKSFFTQLFFFNGHGTKCFQKFDERSQVTGGEILVWKVDWNCQQENKVYFQPKAEGIKEVHASHILISAENRTEEEALGLIKEIQKNLTTSNFAEYAQKYSDCPSSKQGGDLGWFGKGQMVPEFEQAAFSLEKGKISDAVKTQFGYHLILVLEKR